jgi:hypothetical protein
MGNEVKGGKTMVFSISGVNYGYIQSFSVEDIVERAEARGPAGHMMAVQQYNDLKNLNMEYLEFGTSTGGPALSAVWNDGSGVTGVSAWYIDSISYGKTVDGFKTVSVTAKNYPNLA